MSKTIQIRDVDDDVYAALTQRAAEAGVTVPELLRRQATLLATRPSISAWVERTRRRRSPLQETDVISILDDWRGPWPT
jgi:antitoxin FitA